LGQKNGGTAFSSEESLNSYLQLNLLALSQKAEFLLIPRPTMERSIHSIECGAGSAETVHAYELIPRLNTIGHWPAVFSGDASHAVFAVTAHAKNKPDTVEVIRRLAIRLNIDCVVRIIDFDTHCL
jgi:hypothetical protein